MGEGTALPLPRAQRRDQHDPGQCGLDACARGPARFTRPRSREAVASRCGRGRLGLGDARRGPRASGTRRTRPHSCRVDDRARRMGRRHRSRSGACRLLPVSRLPDGAVGRSCRAGLLRRSARCGRTGPQRPPSAENLHLRGRARRVRVGGRRSSDAGPWPRTQDQDRTGSIVLRRSGRGRGDRGCRDQAPPRAPPALWRLAGREHALLLDGRTHHVRRPARRRASGCLGLHEGGVHGRPSPNGHGGSRAHLVHGRRHGATAAGELCEARLLVLEATVRSGHQPPYRPSQRAPRHVRYDPPGSAGRPAPRTPRPLSNICRSFSSPAR
jgi:hypothetical protein